ncbi:MAG: putative ribonuclease III [Candidatus Berkelbacteria bacterium Licking1014_96]|uniref:Ribonuclease 3 n=1 Tax=Candidatus Berkelbacteria bacterium Licking1014_96 TaxID=2017149 RepID=A0A554LG22_9BACT|nr:MAG: putative ribonuclease III [Candidatus Berkelbacteria bacterium Licking1014_96]
MIDLSKFEKKIKIKFKDQKLLQTVFIHRSYLNENKNYALPQNERLEFLGDAVLEFIVTDYLYKKFDNPEGEMTNWRAALVRGEMLSKIANQLKMGDLMMLSHGETKTGGRERKVLLANAFEALIGAIYLDRGIVITRKFINQNLITHLEEIIEKGLYQDAKSVLQEKSQDELGITPTYEVIKESGPDHAKKFVIGVYIGEKLIGQGEGNSKQEGQQEAAKKGLSSWDK